MPRHNPALLVALLLLLPAQAAALDLDDQTYRNRELGLRFAVPEGWLLSRQTGYPAVLALVTHTQGGARMALALASKGEGSADRNVEAIVRGNLAAMRAVGLRIESATARQPQPLAGWRVVARRAETDAAGTWEVRQLYLPAPGQRLLVLTLAAPQREIRGYLLDRDALLASLEVGGAPLPAAVIRAPAPAGGPGGPTATGPTAPPSGQD